MKTRIVIFSLLLCFAFSFADTVNFTTWTVKVETKDSPSGLPDFQNRIEATAKTLIKNLLFDSDRTVEDYLTENTKLARQFDRTSLKSKESDFRYLSDGSTIYEYEIPLTGSLMKLLVPGTGGGIPLATLCCPICKRPWPENTPVPDSVKLIPLENEFTPQYTGILIDARDITLNPSLFLKVFTDEGKQAYGLSFADENYVISQGLVSYTTSFDQAFKSDRLGINPLRITALRSIGLNKTDIVISTASAKMMHSSQHNLGLLEHCQVVVLISE
jgi:hypothetical protein